ncbi:uncharacterized protein LOC101853126 isoform X2 [Aplysia californica]|uniref:Uncharacterized protein LOC101853126 isoform X2 n=1 Tax=Aplysia californica TaxID=6500 RepID=A0ABM0K5P0_APLCA|nr:uncharacterized protein LOC101853126 isoform X2 [Aplysia californica]
MAESVNKEVKEPSSMEDSSAGYETSEGECLEEETSDVYAQLAHKERDLILAAELGKALLDSNQELQTRYDQMVEDFSRKIEILQQEKYDLHLELEKAGTQHQNTVKDLQDDVASLRKQLRNSDQIESSERERSRSLREAQQNTDYLMEQMRQVSAKEEELQKELSRQKEQNETSVATIQDQIDHIAMLREQVEYLSEKLREANQKMIDMEGERDSLTNALEAAHEKLQALELELASRDEQILKQNHEVEELQESNSELQEQLRRRNQIQYHYSPYPNIAFTQGHGNVRSFDRPAAQANHNDLSKNQRNSQNVPSLISQNLPPEPATFHGGHQKTKGSPEDIECSNTSPPSDPSAENSNVDQRMNEKSLLAEFNDSCPELGNDESPPLLSHLSIATESSLPLRHRRNISDGSISSMTEGSRKRHHQNIGGDSDDEDVNRAGDKTGPSSGCKQTLYSKSITKHQMPQKMVSEKSRVILSSYSENNSEVCQPAVKKEKDQTLSSVAISQEENLCKALIASEEAATVLVVGPPLSSGPTFQVKDVIQRSLSLPTDEFSEPDGECGMITSPDSNEKSLLSELSSHILDSGSYSSCPPEQSLFSELSSQLMEDKNGGSCSDSSSTCMMGVFDFSSGQEGHDNEQGSEDLFTDSHSGRPTRHEMDVWHNTTCVAADLLDEDDFECDDDDFLVGNLAGTTLSIGDSGHRTLHYQYHCYGVEEAETDSRTDALYRDDASSKWKAMRQPGARDSQEKISLACVQLRELVQKVQGHPAPSPQPAAATKGPEAVTPDDLLDLIEQMRLCIDRMPVMQADSAEQQGTTSCNAQSISGEEGSAKGQERGVGQDVQISQKSAQMRKSKSSSSLHLRMSL